MFLNLTRRRAYAGAAPLASGAKVQVLDGYESPAIKRILGRLARTPGGQVLDLGLLTGEVVTTFAEAGARVHVHDLLSPLCDANLHGEALNALLAKVDVAPGSLDVVCAWELFDLLPQDLAALALAKIGLWLKPKGWILTVFNVDAVTRVRRYRTTSEGVVTLGAGCELAVPAAASTNSQVVELFSGYQLLNSALMRGRVREVLSQRA